MGSSQTRVWTRVPCIGRRILNHCATREARCFTFYTVALILSFLFFFFTHTHCILLLQEINRLTPSIVHGWPQQKQQWLCLFDIHWYKHIAFYSLGWCKELDFLPATMGHREPQLPFIGSKAYSSPWNCPHKTWLGGGTTELQAFCIRPCSLTSALPTQLQGTQTSTESQWSHYAPHQNSLLHQCNCLRNNPSKDNIIRSDHLYLPERPLRLMPSCPIALVNAVPHSLGCLNSQTLIPSQLYRSPNLNQALSPYLILPVGFS